MKMRVTGYTDETILGVSGTSFDGQITDGVYHRFFDLTLNPGDSIRVFVPIGQRGEMLTDFGRTVDFDPTTFECLYTKLTNRRGYSPTLIPK